MIIRLTYLASAVSLAAASKSAKTPGTGTQAPTDASKAGKAPSSKSSKAGGEYFIAPFSCPQKCISADHYVLNHLLDAVSECDTSDEYQKWNVYFDGDSLKMESAAHNDGGMCLAIIGGCAAGELGLAHCDAEESNWYLLGGNLASRYCWDQGTRIAMSVDDPNNPACTNLVAVEKRVTDSFTIPEEFMFLEAQD